MFGLFRRKAKPAPSRRLPAKQSEPRSASGRFEPPPSLEGYTIQELGTQEVAHAVRLARLTPEQLLRLLSANDRPVQAQPASVLEPDNRARSGTSNES
jgi:hypothetical protein